MNRSLRLLLWLLAADIAFCICLGTGLITGWGHWYSDFFAYRSQTNALLDGSLALTNDPRGLAWDYVWANDGVHQSWGLGVPIWRLPFEFVARICGQSAFPDRLTFAAAIMVVAYCVMRAVLPQQSLGDVQSKVKDEPEVVLAVPILLLFPAFMFLCQSRFWAYEEAQAYSYLAAVALLAAMISFLRQATTARFYWLTTLAGLVALIRPTLLFYGIATLAISWSHTRRLGWRAWKSLAGGLLFCLGLTFLLVTNLLRFGSGLEFGHRLNLNGIDAMRYASRFDDPFRTETFYSASRELFGSLFLTGSNFNGDEWYRQAIFAGQSATFRWREFYFKTFDLSVFAIVCAVWVWWGWQWWRGRNTAKKVDDWSIVRPLAAWSILSACPLLLFYLRCPFVASRYLIDFAPAFAAAMLAALFARKEILPTAWARSSRVKYTICILFFLWWAFELISARALVAEGRFPAPNALTYAQMEARMSPNNTVGLPLPEHYELGMDLEKFAIPFNGVGWDTSSGGTKAAVALFIQDPKQLEIEVAPAVGTQLAAADYEQIQAKIGLEFVTLETSIGTPDGQILIFRGPQSRIYQSGLQVAFLGFAAPENLGEGPSKFRLLRVNWQAN